MDLTAKVAALEEEVNVLKGEIKLILQEVRTALLARENPFTVASTESLALPASLRDERGPSTDRGTSALPESQPQAIAAPVVEMPIAKPVAVKIQPQVVPAPVVIEPLHGNMDVPRLAALVNWTQDTTAKHTVSDVSIILSLARYGGLLEADLEATLAKISRTVTTTSTTRASIGDLLIALRQLEAMVGSDTAGRDAAAGLRAG
ncbi:MAG: hypothetical protein AB7P33_06405 [Dehalococcoidia bacterium]